MQDVEKQYKLANLRSLIKTHRSRQTVGIVLLTDYLGQGFLVMIRGFPPVLKSLSEFNQTICRRTSW